MSEVIRELCKDEIIKNLQESLQQVVRENEELTEELRIQRSDNQVLRDAIINEFVTANRRF